MAVSFMPDWTARTSCLYPQFSLLSSPKWGNGPFGLKLLQFLLLLRQKKLQKIEVTLYSRVAPLHHCWYWNNIFKIKCYQGFFNSDHIWRYCYFKFPKSSCHIPLQRWRSRCCKNRKYCWISYSFHCASPGWPQLKGFENEKSKTCLYQGRIDIKSMKEVFGITE